MRKNVILLTILLIFICCKKKESKIDEDRKDYNEEYSSEVDNNDSYYGNENEEEEEEDKEADELDNKSKFPDGSYDATVYYQNPKTQYSATYTLEVDVEDGEVIKINFPKGGWLDESVHPEESRLYPEEIDENGDALLQDENGRTFDVHIEN